MSLGSNVHGIGGYYKYRLHEQQFLQTGPRTRRLFTDEGILWAKLKQKEKIQEYPVQCLSHRVCEDVEGALCWAFEIAAQEKGRKRD